VRQEVFFLYEVIFVIIPCLRNVNINNNNNNHFFLNYYQFHTNDSTCNLKL